MAGLSLAVGENDPTPTRLLEQSAGQPVSVSLTTGSWSSYSISAPTDGWRLFGPLGSTDTLSGSSSTLEDKVFTPTKAGRYLVMLLATIDGEQVRLTALYEVQSAYLPESVLAPQERDESSTTTGWARSIQGLAASTARMLGGRSVLAVYMSGSSVVTGSLLKLTGGYRRIAGVGAGTDAALSQVTGTVITGLAASATSISDSEILVLALSDIDEGAIGQCVLRGVVPFDTSGAAVDDSVFLSDDGTLSLSAGTTSRIVGRVLSVGAATLADSPDIGSILFNGEVQTTAAQSSGNSFDPMRINALTEFVLSDWQDAAAVGGLASTTRYVLPGNAGVAFKPNLDADGLTVTGARTQGILTTVESGDFCCGVRVSFTTSSRNWLATFGDNCNLSAVFVDGSDVGADAWYGVTNYYFAAGSWPQTPSLYATQSTVGTSRWGTTSSTSTRGTPWDHCTSFDAWFVRSGTTLTVYFGRIGEIPHRVSSWTASTGTGLLGLRFGMSAGGPDNAYVCSILAHSRSASSNVPWE